jgi:hypothetical protein
VELFNKNEDNTERSLSSNAFERVTVRFRDLFKISNEPTSAPVLEKSSIRYDLNCAVMRRNRDKKLGSYLFFYWINRVTYCRKAMRTRYAKKMVNEMPLLPVMAIENRG